MGYRWRIVLIVVDAVCWLGKIETNRTCYVIEYDGWDNTSNMYIDWLLYMINVYIHCIVWKEIGDVLHGLGGDRGWTPKPDTIWEEIGDGLHWYSKYVNLLWSKEVFWYELLSGLERKCFNVSRSLIKLLARFWAMLWIENLISKGKGYETWTFVMELNCGISGFISGSYLSNANVLVISLTWFSISLLGIGAPYMGHHFQVQMVCHLQGHSLGGLEAEDLFFVVYLLCITCKFKPMA